jgi:undecaprenyl diphosphate synthase
MALSVHSMEPAGTAPPPRHVAIIMDGNGRWATKHGLRRAQGHKQGTEAVREAIQGAGDTGVKFLTLYAFSSENWNRPPEEVSDLMGLLKLYLSKEIRSLHKEGVRLRVIGSRARLSADILRMIDKAESKTAANKRLTLVIALSYGAREEITEAVRAISARVRDGKLEPQDISEAMVENALFTHDIPDPDLIIRTSGEQRLSNFLLWQCAYSEFLFIDTLWPDFTRADFASAVEHYGMRDRRYGVRP